MNSLCLLATMPAMAIWCLWGGPVGGDWRRSMSLSGAVPIKRRSWARTGCNRMVLSPEKGKKRRLGACLTLACTAEKWGKHFGKFLFLVAYVLSFHEPSSEWDMSFYAWPIHLVWSYGSGAGYYIFHVHHCSSVSWILKLWLSRFCLCLDPYRKL